MSYTPQFNPQPFGNVVVPTPGTPVQLTSVMQNITVGSGKMCASTDPVLCNKISLIASPITQGGSGNTGNLYIGQKTMVRATLAGVVAVIAPGGGFSVTNNVSMNIYDLSQWYVDADNANDGVYGSADTV